MNNTMPIVLGICVVLAVGTLMVKDEPRGIPQVKGDCALPKTTGQMVVSETWMKDGKYLRECRTYVGVKK